MAGEHRIGRVNSGDVSLFYRAFGTASARPPILLLHGSNYYDSYDWIDVASKLATDRLVVTPDRRGWGESTWSPSKDYSRDALVDDMLAAMKANNMTKPIVVGHSGAGPVVISFAVNFPDQITKLIVLDSQMNRDEDAVTGPTVGNPPTMFASIEACMERFARINNTPRIGLDRERAINALIKLESGYLLKRDPDNGNRKPIGENASMPRRPVREMWAEFKMVKTPTILIRGTKSDRYPPETVERFTKELPHIPQKTVDSQHDVARMAPDAVVAHIKEFIGTT